MKLNMIVVMTMWLPRLACRIAGMNAQAAPAGEGQDDRQRQVQPPGQDAAEGQRHRRDAEPADIGLALAADVEQPAMEGDRDGEPGEDEVGGVVEREADALAIAEGAAQHQHRRLDRALADREDDEPGDGEGDDEVDQRDQPVVDQGGSLA